MKAEDSFLQLVIIWQMQLLPSCSAQLRGRGGGSFCISGGDAPLNPSNGERARNTEERDFESKHLTDRLA